MPNCAEVRDFDHKTTIFLSNHNNFHVKFVFFLAKNVISWHKNGIFMRISCPVKSKIGFDVFFNLRKKGRATVFLLSPFLMWLKTDF